MRLHHLGPISLVALLLLASGCALTPSTPSRRFDFALIGDLPYSDEAATNAFPNLLGELNQSRLAFVVHDGDFKSGSTPCTDELFMARFEQFQSSKHPFVFVYGDNEWCDCGRVKAMPLAPEDRLAKLREIFSKGDSSLGKRTMRLERQSDSGTAEFAAFRENVRWTMGGVVFVALNIPGNSNNYGTPEYPARNAANLEWMRQSFTLATKLNSRGVMVIIQANPHFDLPATNSLRRGFNEFLTQLQQETVAFQKPVVLVHGDSHYFRIDKPMVGSSSGRRIENFTRVETFGNPDAHWIRARVDGKDPNIFSFRQQIVRRNLVRQP